MQLSQNRDRVVIKSFHPRNGQTARNQVETGCRPHGYQGIVRDLTLTSP
jgi:hypothetical protein